jgi:hypothetical protein
MNQGMNRETLRCGKIAENAGILWNMWEYYKQKERNLRVAQNPLTVCRSPFTESVLTG